MEFFFVTAAGETLFTRSDAESAHWIVHEYGFNALFQYDAKKVIERGQRIAFRDPYTDSFQMFEIRQAENDPVGAYQQISGEHIAVSELQDDHINNAEITDTTVSDALTSVLTGSLWTVGNVTATNVSSADISRGSVWQALNRIAQNWNVYITPRIVISATGQIMARYIDVEPAGGTFRGLRLSIRKNFRDPIVTYNDEDVITAMYGYGGTVGKIRSGSDDQNEELTFADVVWTETADHPAKPAGQAYINDPAATALYGRNGRPRYGYYQNSSITDAEILLQKTWEMLQRSNKPKINISGTCADMKRLGYADVPVRLHDLAIVEIDETGEVFEKEVIMLDVDLLDASNTAPTIGDYIPNIIYINREINEHASGGGGGGGRGQTNAELEESDTFALFEKSNDMIGMVVGTRNGGYYVKAGEIALAINKSGETGSYESTATISADHVNISATSDVYTLAGSLERDADGRLVVKDAGGLYVQRTSGGSTVTVGVWDRGNLTGGVMVSNINGQSSLKLKADVIDIDGVITALVSKRVEVGTLYAGGISVSGTARFFGTWAEWKSQSVITAVNMTDWYYFQDTGGTIRYGRLCTGTSSETLHYLGY